MFNFAINVGQWQYNEGFTQNVKAVVTEETVVFQLCVTDFHVSVFHLHPAGCYEETFHSLWLWHKQKRHQIKDFGNKKSWITAVVYKSTVNLFSTVSQASSKELTQINVPVNIINSVENLQVYWIMICLRLIFLRGLVFPH